MQIRRRFVRWQINHPAKVKLEGAVAYAKCYLKDISLKGFQIALAIKLEKDKFLKLCLVLHDEFVLDVEAWVIWHKSIDGNNVYGLYFTKVKDADKEKIYQFIRRNFPNELNKQWWKDFTEEKGGEKMEDRRVFDRFPVELSLKFLDLNQNREGQAKTYDINAKGMGLVSNEELAVRTPLEMWLLIPDKGEPLYARGEVVWSQKLEQNRYRTGVKLEKADLMGVSRVLRAV